jgi:hypothetical protein
MNACFSFLLVASVFAFSGCSRASETSTLTNDTWRLDSMTKEGGKSAEFAQKVELYYGALEKKDWATSYDLRTSAFKHDVARNLYLKQIGDAGENLRSYKVLNVRMYGDMTGDYMAAELIMEFQEGGIDSYSCSRWIRRGGNWMCDEPGLSGIFLSSTRIPDWTTQ